ncbi:MAG: phosphonate ABC transporter, permease protein PhnE [Planctomycetota bacterium]
MRQQWRIQQFRNALAWLAASALLLCSFWWSEFNLKALAESGPHFSEFFTRMIPPNTEVAGPVFRATIETFMIAFAGTFLGVLVAFPLGVLAASNISPWWIAQPVKLLLGFLRSIPLIVVAILFVVAVGLGPFPGALAIAFHSIGMLGKFYAEEFETVEPGIVEAIRGTGASWAQTIRFGLLPQSIPQVVSFTVYRREMNFRDATVLGLVGAGGIGYYIQIYVRSFQYDKVATLLLVILLMVTLLDLLTYRVRKRMR